MSRTSPRCKPIPEEVRQTADLLERRWQLSVLYAALTGALRFSEFAAAVRARAGWLSHHVARDRKRPPADPFAQFPGAGR